MKILFLILFLYIFWAIISYNSNIRFVDPKNNKKKKVKIKSLYEVDRDQIRELSSLSELDSEYYFVKFGTGYQYISKERLFCNKKLYSTDPYYKIFSVWLK